MILLAALLAMLAAYLVGSLSFAVLISRVMGLADPRSYGSRNPGATNVLRSGNRAAAVLTLALDALKGYVPVLLCLVYGPRYGLGETAAAFVGLAAFLGHLWPVFFRFQGGKGVATAAGVLMALNPWLGLATLATWLIIAAFFRYSSLASVVAAVFAPFYQALIWGLEPGILALIGMSLLLVWRHEGNIRKLIAGTESKLGQKAAAGHPPAAAPARAFGQQRAWPRQTQEGTPLMVQRFDVGTRLSEMAVHNGVCYLAGQVAADGSQDITGQTRQVLAAVDALLARAGTDKSKILRVQIFIKDLADFPALNAVWEAWVPAGHAPPRATVQANLAKPEWRVEMVVTAAL
ncbi:MAG: glycerol-3-phosphate 1-O-acyltransferase PlsY [Betaproteobacteria bacterium]|nr:glycerol-3-phosphate 1-O-acyltransferase PlsY [Betaproteobacteria bacterium]